MKTFGAIRTHYPIAIIDNVFSLDSMLALAFLVVAGTVLIAEAFEIHVPKGYVYFATAFSLGVEALNIRMRTARSRKHDSPLLDHNGAKS